VNQSLESESVMMAADAPLPWGADGLVFAGASAAALTPRARGRMRVLQALEFPLNAEQDAALGRLLSGI
jgi:hypothetical protein